MRMITYVFHRQNLVVKLEGLVRYVTTIHKISLPLLNFALHCTTITLTVTTFSVQLPAL